jgi:hypothetical protein
MPNKLLVRFLTASVLLVFLLKAFPVGANAAEIKIASWNIYWLTSEDPDHYRRKASDYTRLAAYANDLDRPVTESCRELKSQVRPLESWIDRRLERGRAFVLLGDFNRRMDRRSDDLWRFIADGNPKPIYRVNAGKKPKCWNGRFPEFIDHIVVGPIAGKAVKPNSFEELTYSERNYFRWRKRLSDHCPVSVRLVF